MTEVIFYNPLNILFEGSYFKLKALKEKFPSWQSAWENLKLADKKNLDPKREWGKLEKLGVNLTLRENNGYPDLLREIPHPPHGLYSIGNLKPDCSNNLAIVGTRKATESGKELAKTFAHKLSLSGVNIVSGLALGIDAASHEGALAGGGFTVAVLGNGLDRLYPRQNERLAKKIIAAGGAIVSEYPLGSPSLPYRFLERNRIVSGLSKGVLIIEAPERSGSLVTARFAIDQNREVFAIPGPVSHPNFFGSHKLIQSGANLATAPEEILAMLNLKPVPQGTTSRQLFSSENEEEGAILKTLESQGQPLSIDKIIELTNLNAKTVNQTVSFLLIKNIVRETDQGYTI